MAFPIATAVWLWWYGVASACAGESWPCKLIIVLAIGAVSYGFVYAVAYTSVAVALTPIVLLLKPSATTLEPRQKAVPVALTLFAAQTVGTGAIAAVGGLPQGWRWWLGAFGALLQ